MEIIFKILAVTALFRDKNLKKEEFHCKITENRGFKKENNAVETASSTIKTTFITNVVFIFGKGPHTAGFAA